MFVYATYSFVTPMCRVAEGEIIEIPSEDYDRGLMSMWMPYRPPQTNKVSVENYLYCMYFEKGFEDITTYLDEKGVEHTLHWGYDKYGLPRKADFRYWCAPKLYDQVVRPVLRDLYHKWHLEYVVKECTRNDNLCIRNLYLLPKLDNVKDEQLRTVCGPIKKVPPYRERE